METYRRQRESSAGLQRLVAEGRLSFGEFSRLMSAGCFMPVEEHIALIETAAARGGSAQGHGRERPGVIVSGILPPPSGIIRCIEEAGLRVADNDIAMFRRSYGYTPRPAHDPADYYLTCQQPFPVHNRAPHRRCHG